MPTISATQKMTLLKADPVEHEHEELLEGRVVVQEDQDDDEQDETGHGPEPLPAAHDDLRILRIPVRGGRNRVIRIPATPDPLTSPTTDPRPAPSPAFSRERNQGRNGPGSSGPANPGHRHADRGEARRGAWSIRPCELRPLTLLASRTPVEEILPGDRDFHPSTFYPIDPPPSIEPAIPRPDPRRSGRSHTGPRTAHP